jgi:mRNA interferase HigB
LRSAAQLEEAELNLQLIPKWDRAKRCVMRIIARRTLRQFVESLAGHKDQSAVKAALDSWFDEVSKANWANSSEIKQLYATASVVSAERVVFNIKGNAYRLVVAIDFEKSIVWIKWLGTHRDYDKIDVAEVGYDG